MRPREASQKTNISTKIIKENIDVFADFLCTSINSAIKSFPSFLKLADVTPLHRKWERIWKKILGQ